MVLIFAHTRSGGGGFSLVCPFFVCDRGCSHVVDSTPPSVFFLCFQQFLLPLLPKLLFPPHGRVSPLDLGLFLMHSVHCSPSPPSLHGMLPITLQGKHHQTPSCQRHIRLCPPRLFRCSLLDCCAGAAAPQLLRLVSVGEGGLEAVNDVQPPPHP